MRDRVKEVRLADKKSWAREIKVIGIYKIGRNFYKTKILLDFILKNESTISIIDMLTIITIRL